MRLASVTAHALGPLTGESLELAPGFNIVWGLNEAGKSTWHSAIYLAITGLRRSRGRARKDDQVMIDRHRPWTGDQWRVEAELHLESGEQLMVSWDLNNRVAKVLDALGRDRSNEWISDGACDLAQLVGLDRSSFLATACVRQSDLRGVGDGAHRLQDLLQKAATSAEADSTASSAIERLDRYAQDHVGLDRANSTKPLAQAKRRVETARQAMADEEEAHTKRLGLLEQISARHAEHRSIQHEIAALDAAEQLAKARAELHEQEVALKELDKLRTALDAARDDAAHHDQVINLVGVALTTADVRRRHEAADNHAQKVHKLASDLDNLKATTHHHEQRQGQLFVASDHAARREALVTAKTAAAEAKAARRSADDAAANLNDIERRLGWTELEIVDRAALRSSKRSRKATELADRHPTAPPTSSDRDDLARRAHALMARWSSRPVVDELTGPSSVELQTQIDALPATPQGDTAPTEEVLAAERSWDVTGEVLKAHRRDRPLDPAGPAAPGHGHSPADLRSWAQTLESPKEDPAIVSAELRQTESDAAKGAVAFWPIGIGLALTVVGLAAGFLAHPALFALTLLGIGFAVLLGRRGIAKVDSEVTVALRGRLDHARAAEGTAERVVIELRKNDLPDDPGQLRVLAEQLETSRLAHEQQRRWLEDETRLTTDVDHRADQLLKLLVQRGVSTEEPGVALATYRRACAERSRQAEQAGARTGLLTELNYRERREAQVDEARQSLTALGSDLAGLATSLDLEQQQPAERLVEAIEGWLTKLTERQTTAQRAHDEWAELENLLGDDTLAELQAQAEQDARQREKRAGAVELPRPSDVDPSALDDRALQEHARQLRTQVSAVGQEAARFSAGDPSEDPEAAVADAQRQVGESLRQLRLLTTDGTNDLEALSVDYLKTLLAECEQERDASRSSHDEAAGRLRQLRGAAPDPASPAQSVTDAEQTLTTRRQDHPRAADAVPFAASDEALQQLLDEHRPAHAAAIDLKAKIRGRLEERERASSEPFVLKDQLRGLELSLAGLEPQRILGIDMANLPSADELAERTTDSSERSDEIGSEVAGLEGQLRERDAASADPAAATESHQAALRELDRVQDLEAVLNQTKALLEAAEERVHRDIAPRLNAATNRWLPEVFGKRYTKVLIDPATLDVQVFAAGEAQRADLLSHGTTEQFYLLLRIALVEILTEASGESCPLILDDITVNFDGGRRTAVLELLHEVAAERQVVLFTKEDDVREWAETNLGETGRLTTLAGRVG